VSVANSSGPRTGNLEFIELADLNDGLLLPWLDLYETASGHLKVLKETARGGAEDQFLLAAVAKNDELVGMASYEVARDSGLACLWYLAVVPERRSQGTGSCLYREIVRRASECGCRLLLFEVEIPEEGHSEEMSELARRRIGFYQRLGAGVLDGVHYIQSVGPHQPAIPMHIMLHPLESLELDEAFRIAKSLLGDAIRQIGPLTLCTIRR